MANRITEEMKVQINELYYRLKVKAAVARELGISASSVSRYIIPNYVPIDNRSKIVCNAKPNGCKDFVESLKAGGDFRQLTKLTEEEYNELVELRKEIYI